ncbi:kelch repeat-containing protein [Cystobacter fuscus]
MYRITLLSLAVFVTACEGEPRERPPASLAVHTSAKHAPMRASALVADDQWISTRKNTPATVTLSASGTEGGPLDYAIVTGPASGRVEQNGASVTYIPHPGFAGSDSFTYRASDGVSQDSVATVHLQVINVPPVAHYQLAWVEKNGSKSITLSATDADGEELTYALVKSPGHGTLRQTGARVLYTPETGFVGADSFTFRALDSTTHGNTATVSLVVVNDGACMEFAGRWVSTGNLSGPRIWHTATLLEDGEVLVSGGFNKSTELYDPLLGSWSPGAKAWADQRHHTTTRLPDGQVLMAGGDGSQPGSFTQLYDPTTRLWMPGAPMNSARQDHSATLLPDGRVLVTGGGDTDSGAVRDSAELYEPTTHQWSPTHPMTTARQTHTSTLLHDGRVLVTGGRDASGRRLASAELYDPTLGTWTRTGDMAVARGDHTATLLPDGRVLIAGGAESHEKSQTSELYDPALGTWTVTGDMLRARRHHTALLLPDGQVFVVGGYNDREGILSLAELFDARSGVWKSAGCSSVSRWGTTATLLSGPERVLIAGGISNGDQSSVDLYFPASR